MRLTIRIHSWNDATAAERQRLLERPPALRDDALQSAVLEIVSMVRKGGDAALSALTRRFDGVAVDSLRVSEEEFDQAERDMSPAALAAIELSIGNVRRFHEAQLPVSCDIETMPGIRCQRVSRPVDCVGLYVPAGSAPLPSTAIMLSVPAAIAECPRRVMCTPPRKNGRADSAVLAAARRGGVTEIYKVGGAQAIAAMAFGTESIPKVDKIFGPGNAWVTAAKSLIAAAANGTAIDMPAGPSEVMVMADSSASAEFVAADLLSQAEHGSDSQVLLVTTDRDLAQEVSVQIELQLPRLARRSIAAEAMQQSRFIVANNVTEATEISNAYAPEHLILQIDNPRDILPAIRNAGSVFLGPWSPESAGDYCSGTNHVLPTSGYARSFSGLSVDEFMRRMTVQELSEAGLRSIAGPITELANLEGLDAHAAAVTCRMQPGDDAPGRLD
jgi:histidinol dehydrogenase